MRYKVGDWVRVKYVPDGESVEVGEIGTIVFCSDDLRVYAVEFTEYSRCKNSCDMHCKDGFGWWCKEEMLELFTRSKFKAGDRVRIKDNGDWDSDIITIGETGTIIEYSISHKLYRVEFDNYNTFKHDCGGRCRKGYGWNCEEKMLEPIFAEGGLIPTPEKPVPIEEQLGLPKGIASIHDIATHELWTTPFIIPKDRLDALVDAWTKLGCTTFNLVPDEVKELIKKTEEKKMPTKFTFYVTEGTRLDKSCNGTIPTMTTTVEANNYSRTAPVGTATCDKADYDMRQGVLEALANMYCDGDFDKVYKKAVKANKRTDEVKRTCKYCGKTFNTIEEKEAEEAWHVERRKARHERYLLRKRAKEIAFENAAQKLAKEMADLK